MRSLADSLRNGKQISFDYGQQYTYHLPKMVFKTHVEIIEFFNALYRLYYGNFKPFIDAVHRIENAMSALKQAPAVPPATPLAN